MENIIVSQNSLFWNKLGKWQMLFVALTLTAFFTALHFTGDKEKATAIATSAIVCIASIVTIIIITSNASAIIAMGVIAFAAIAFAATATLVAFIAFATISFLAADEMKKYGIKKRVVWLSFTAEFAIILLPMLLA